MEWLITEIDVEAVVLSLSSSKLIFYYFGGEF
jgi:hypothetical protein